MRGVQWVVERNAALKVDSSPRIPEHGKSPFSCTAQWPPQRLERRYHDDNKGLRHNEHPRTSQYRFLSIFTRISLVICATDVNRVVSKYLLELSVQSSVYNEELTH